MRKILSLFMAFCVLVSGSMVSMSSVAFANEGVTVRAENFSNLLGEDVLFYVYDQEFNVIDLPADFYVEVQNSVAVNVANSQNPVQISKIANPGFGNPNYRINVDLPLGYYFITLYDAAGDFYFSSDFEVVQALNNDDDGNQVEETRYTLQPSKFEYLEGEMIEFRLINQFGHFVELEPGMRFSIGSLENGALNVDINTLQSQAVQSANGYNFVLNSFPEVSHYALDLFDGDDLVTSSYFYVLESDYDVVTGISLSSETYVEGNPVYFSMIDDNNGKIYAPEIYWFKMRRVGDPSPVVTTANGRVQTILPTQNIPFHYRVDGLLVGEYIFDVVQGNLLRHTINFDVVEAEAVAANDDSGAAVDAGNNVDGAVGNNNPGAAVDASNNVDGAVGNNNPGAAVDAGNNVDGAVGNNNPGAAVLDFAFEIADGEMFFEARQNAFCADLEDSFWGRVIVETLIKSGQFPLQRVGETLNCRVGRELTRGEFTAWLMMVFYPEEAMAERQIDYAALGLNDVFGNAKYDKYIALAFEKGVISGYPDGYFRTNNVINRAEVLKILLRSSGVYLNTDDELKALIEQYPANDPILRFMDVSVASDYFYGYLYYAMNRYDVNLQSFLIEGRVTEGNLRQAAMGDPILFGEAAKLLYMLR